MTMPRWTEEVEWTVRMTGVSGPQARRILTALADAGALVGGGKEVEINPNQHCTEEAKPKRQPCSIQPCGACVEDGLV